MSVRHLAQKVLTEHLFPQKGAGERQKASVPGPFFNKVPEAMQPITAARAPAAASIPAPELSKGTVGEQSPRSWGWHAGKARRLSTLTPELVKGLPGIPP